MRPSVAMGLYLLGVFLAAAVVAPGIYHLLHGASEVFPTLKPMADEPFHRYVNRSLLVIALAGIWPLRRAIRLSGAQLGLGQSWLHLRQATAGFAFGFASLAVAALLNLAFGGRAWDADRSLETMLKSVGEAAIVALLVAVIEEIFFRGALFGTLRKDMRWPAALVLSSLIYAIVHFFRRPEPPETITWISGLVTLGRMLRGFADFQELVPAFFNLALAGIILGLAYQRSGSLYFSIGLHAGWIFWLKFFGTVTTGAGGGATWIWGSRKLIDGWAAAAVLLAVLVWLPGDRAGLWGKSKEANALS